MNLVPRRQELIRGGLAGVGGVLGSAIMAGISSAFIAAPIAGIFSRIMPGWVITLVITTLGKFGQPFNLAIATLTAIVGLGLLTVVVLLLNRRLQYSMLDESIATAGLGWVVALLVTNALVASVGVGVGMGVFMVASGLRFEADQDINLRARRRVIGTLVGLLGLGGIATWSQGGIGEAGGGSPAVPSTPVPGERILPSQVMAQDSIQSAVDEQLAVAEEQSLGIDTMEPLISDRFYEVDINAVNPEPSAEDWRLRITGAVNNELRLSIDEILTQDPEHRFVTLRCVGEALNGHQLDNALWTGIPVASLLEQAEPTGDYVMLRAVDDYFEGFPLEALEPGFLAYGMNGQPLPTKHGYPLRALVPGHWGEINVKWLTEIEVLTEEREGFWEKRGWHGTGPVNTVAKLHAVNYLDNDRIEVGGHAYAGTRGIDTVEVSIDGGSSWQEAVLSDPLPGDDVWRQWRLEYPSPGEEHDVVVRAIDGTGTLQTKARHEAFPSGATGWVSSTVDPS